MSTKDTRRVKFFKLLSTEHYQDDGYSNTTEIVGDSVSEWLEVPNESFHKIYAELAKKWNRSPAYGTSGVHTRLIVIEDPMITEADLRITLEKIKETEKNMKKAEEEKKKKADDRKKQKEMAKIKDKKALLEALKAELGEK